MRKFLAYIFSFVLLIGIINMIVGHFMALSPSNYALLSHEINVKNQMKRLSNLDSPKIIIIGGSGCGFGLSSPMISSHYGMPISNTGTHADLGLRLQLELCKPYIGEGDMVIVIPEWHQYVGLTCLGDEAALRILSTYPEGYKSFSFFQQLYLSRLVVKCFLDAQKCKAISSLPEYNPYSSASLNEYGDVEAYEYRLHIDSLRALDGIDGLISSYPFSLLESMHHFCDRKHASMFVCPPAYSVSAYNLNKSKVDEIWSKLCKTNLNVVGTPEHYILPDTFFYDSEYHLTKKGIMLRTRRLINDVSAVTE